MKSRKNYLIGLASLFVSILLLGGARCWAKKKEPLNYTVAQKEWGLAVGAILTKDNSADFYSLAGRWNSPREQKIVQDILSTGWGVHSRKDLLHMLNRVWTRGHRGSMQEIRRGLAWGWSPQAIRLYSKFRGHPCSFRRIEWVRNHADELGENSMVAWDLSRLVSLVRWGVFVGYLSDEEAWEWIMPAAKKIQASFNSWQEFGEDYLLGRSFWSPNEMKRSGDRFRRNLYWLIHAPNGPWVSNDWNLNLTGTAEPLEEKETLPETARYFEGVDLRGQKKYLLAAESYRQSIKEDRPLYKGRACNALGGFYRWGKEGIETNKTLAFQFYRQGAELQDADCLNSVGWNYYWEGDYSNAVEYLKRAAAYGSVYALKNLAILYGNEKTGMKSLPLLYKYYNESVRWGCASAKNNLAWVMYENSEYWDADRAVKLAYEAVEYEKTFYSCDTLMWVLIKAERYPEALKAWEDWASFYKQKVNNWDDLALPENVKKVRQDILEKR